MGRWSPGDPLQVEGSADVRAAASGEDRRWARGGEAPFDLGSRLLLGSRLPWGSVRGHYGVGITPSTKLRLMLFDLPETIPVSAGPSRPQPKKGKLGTVNFG